MRYSKRQWACTQTFTIITFLLMKPVLTASASRSFTCLRRLKYDRDTGYNNRTGSNNRAYLQGWGETSIGVSGMESLVGHNKLCMGSIRLVNETTHKPTYSMNSNTNTPHQRHHKCMASAFNVCWPMVFCVNVLILSTLKSFSLTHDY